MARYIFLQYVDESKAPPYGSPELNAQIEAFAKYLDEVKAAGAFKDGDPCQPSAAGFSVSVHDGHAKTTDGPMHAQSPWLNGYFVLECKDRAEAAAWAATRSSRCSADILTPRPASRFAKGSQRIFPVSARSRSATGPTPTGRFSTARCSAHSLIVRLSWRTCAKR